MIFMSKVLIFSKSVLSWQSRQGQEEAGGSSTTGTLTRKQAGGNENGGDFYRQEKKPYVVQCSMEKPVSAKEGGPQKSEVEASENEI